LDVNKDTFLNSLHKVKCVSKHGCFYLRVKKVKLSRYRLEEALEVPGG
jgi:heterodisulfide reductase subunit B